MKITRWRADRKPTADEIRSMLEEEGLELTIESYPPHSAVKEHTHPFDEIRMVAQGTIRYNVAGNEFLLREGDRLDLPSNTRHWTKVEGDHECVSILAYRVT